MGQLMLKDLHGTATDAEKRELADWLALSPRNQVVHEDFMNRSTREALLQAQPPHAAENVLAELLAKRHRSDTTKRSDTARRIRRVLGYAAAILVVATSATWVFLGTRLQNPADVLPGSNRATLTLADGRTFNLDEAQTGIIVGVGEITYADGNLPVTRLGGTEESLTPETLVLTTPKGGTYQVTLPDGSQVWLNANSTLRYPVRFVGSERSVFLDGEAYFDVSAQKRPFKVTTKDQEIEVLGTGFNIAAYPDDHETRTTLVEGRVKVSVAGNPRIFTLTPGQQAMTRGMVAEIRTVDTSQHVAWKSGHFSFNGTLLPDAMRQLGRWYDVEIQYEGEAPQLPFYGKISRKSTLNEVLEIMKTGDVNFRLEKRGNQKARIVVLQ